jgi:hypothetical protein
MGTMACLVDTTHSFLIFADAGFKMILREDAMAVPKFLGAASSV